MTMVRGRGLAFHDQLEFAAADRELSAAAPFLSEEECQEFEFDLLVAAFDQLGPRRKPELDLTDLRERIALRRFKEN